MTRLTAKTRVTLSFDAKISEMEFYLNLIESEWKATILEQMQNGQQKNLTHLDKINYYFSGFSNSFQSVKDVLQSIIGAVPWSVFSKIDNYLFIKDSRNAITHDGLQLINTFQGGRYYTTHAGGSLKRYYNDKEVEIHCPAEDIVTVCKNFYVQLLFVIKEIIEANPQDFEVNNKDFSEMAINAINESSAIPEFVKQLLKENPTLIAEARGEMLTRSGQTFIKRINERISNVNLTT